MYRRRGDMGLTFRGIFMFGVTVAFRLIATEIPRRVASWGRPTHWISSLPAWGLVLFGMSCLGLILAGYRPISTQGDSMDPTIAGGSLLLARRVLPEHVRVGDIIGFPDASGEFPLVVHRVLAVLTDAEHITAVTKGDNNPMPDLIPVTLDRPVTRVAFVLPALVSSSTVTLVWYLCVIGALLGQWLGLRRRAQAQPFSLQSP